MNYNSINFKLNYVIMSTIINFKTLHNNGSIESYTNSCLWISVQQYFIFVLRKQISVKEIRQHAQFHKKYNSDFNFRNEKHLQNLLLFLNKFNVSVRVYYANNKDGVTNLSKYNEEYGDNKNNIIPIVAFGNHFELIISGVDDIPSFEHLIDNIIVLDNGYRIDLHYVEKLNNLYLIKLINEYQIKKVIADENKTKIEKHKIKLNKIEHKLEKHKNNQKSIKYSRLAETRQYKVCKLKCLSQHKKTILLKILQLQKSIVEIYDQLKITE